MTTNTLPQWAADQGWTLEYWNELLADWQEELDHRSNDKSWD